jgi:hypothetical protein
MEVTPMKSVSTNSAVSFHEQNFSTLPLDHEIIFSDYKNVYKKRIEKRQTKLAKKIPILKNFLQDDEKILLMTTGCSPISMIEQLLTGWIFIYLKRSLFVFTNKRIFHIPTKKDYSYRNSIAEIVYADCKSIQIKGKKLIIEYKSEKKETFLYIAGKEKKKIKSLLSNISFAGNPGTTPQRRHLCPRCTKALEESKYICYNCNLEFKNKAEAKRISLIYPGGGYFYTRHPFLGIGDAITETILLILVIASLVGLINGARGAGVNSVIFAIALIIEKAITVYHSNHFIKEYIPREKEIKPIA